MKDLKLKLAAALAGVLTPFLVSSVAMAHVVVTPAEVTTATRVTFAVSVPNENDIPVVSVRLVIPAGLESVRPYAKAGWDVQVAKSGEGENVTATEITWTGGSVPVDLKDDFLFGAKTPANDLELKWKAYETYADGTVVAWEQEPSETEDNKPYSTTQVVTNSSQQNIDLAQDNEVGKAANTGKTALLVGFFALVASLASVAMITRK